MQQAINSNQDLQIALVCIVYELNIFFPIYHCFTPSPLWKGFIIEEFNFERSVSY